MPIQARREYLKAIRERYRKSSKSEKTRILNEFVLNCRYHRKYAIRILNGMVEPGRIESRGAKSKYVHVRRHLERLWSLMGRMCSKKMHHAFGLWLPYYKAMSASEKELLLRMSPSTIDRLLKDYRVRRSGKGVTTTVPVLKHRIPIKLLDGDISEPGYVESDTVSHCGESAAGKFASSLTITDLYSGWTEVRATWTKQAPEVIRQIKSVEKGLPFKLKGFASDNGNEFINDELYGYFFHRLFPVEFVRRRPYRKNDNAHVEQKNFTHVRSLVGYERFDDPELVAMMNEIYRVYWSPLCNYFTPVMKLASKERVGSRVVKRYDTPKTPCQRLCESPHLPRNIKRKLKDRLRAKNPFYLRAQLDKKLKAFFRKVEDIKKLRQHTTAA